MIHKLPRFLLIPVMIFVLASPLTAGDNILQLKKSIRQFRPFHCRFVQEYFDAFQEKTISSSGHFSFMQPALMKWSYEQPEEMLLVIGREKIWLYDPLLENVTIQPLSEVSGVRSLSFLSGEEDISLHFKEIVPKKIFVDRKKGLKSVFLTPKEANQALTELQILYDDQANQLHEFVMIDHNENYRKIRLSQIVIHEDMKESEFEFIVKDNMEIIQGINN
jgi:outer membrane lipoprotein carrier protein